MHFIGFAWDCPAYSKKIGLQLYVQYFKRLNGVYCPIVLIDTLRLFRLILALKKFFNNSLSYICLRMRIICY